MITGKNSLRVSLFATAALSLVLAGCTLEEAKDAPASPSVPLNPAPPVMPAAPPDGASTPHGPTAGAASGPATGSAGGPAMEPPMMGMSSPMAPLTPTPELDAKIVTAEKGGDKKAIAVAYAERGTFRMNDAKAGARIKYRKALADFRKALAGDPTNASAKSGLQTIEGIYQSMGRPVPQDEE